MTHSTEIKVSDNAVCIVGGSDCNSDGFGKIISIIKTVPEIYSENCDIIIRGGITATDIPPTAYMTINAEGCYVYDTSPEALAERD